MTLLIGMDEAGYGPNLGPLVIAATVFRAAYDVSHADLYSLLDQGVTAQPSAGHDRRLWIADSKRLYQTGRGLAAIEYPLGAAFRSIGWGPRTWSELWRQADQRYGADANRLPWHRERTIDLPMSRWNDVTATWDDAPCWPDHDSLQLDRLLARVVEPIRFNSLMRRWGNKAQLLSRLTLNLAREAASAAQAGESIRVLCDRHGGRRSYASLLHTHFPDSLVQVRQESAARSCYRTAWRDHSLEIDFVTRAEQYLAPALASMFAKYLRELSMANWNAFWQHRIQNLKATAGYPLDARRFHDAIAAERSRLQIPDSWTWRVR